MPTILEKIAEIENEVRDVYSPVYSVADVLHEILHY